MRTLAFLLLSLLLAACDSDPKTTPTTPDQSADQAETSTSCDSGTCDAASDGAASDGAASDGAVSDGATCDPATPSLALPDPHEPAELLHLSIKPMDLDPASDNYSQSEHQLIIRTDPGVQRRDELFLFLPGTGNMGQGFGHLGELAAKAGFPVLVLAYDSEINQAAYCQGVSGPDAIIACRTAVIDEKLYGTDETDVLDIDEANSVVGRTRRVLEFVAQTRPEVGAANYLEGDTLRWDRIVVVGFSQGAAVAGRLSFNHPVARAVFLAGGCDASTIDGTVYLAGWCSGPRATPPERTFALRHVSDEPEEDHAIHEAAGLFAFGDYAHAPSQSPDYCTGTHLVETDLPSAHDGGGKSHLSCAHDSQIPLDASGVPVLAEDYLYLFMGGL